MEMQIAFSLGVYEYRSADEKPTEYETTKTR